MIHSIEQLTLGPVLPVGSTLMQLSIFLGAFVAVSFTVWLAIHATERANRRSSSAEAEGGL